MEWTNLVVGIMFLVILIVFCGKVIYNKKRFDEETETVNVSRQTINAIGEGDYNPTINLCRAISRVFGRTLDELFWEK